MTMQLPEALEYQGEWYSLHTLPLEPYLARLPERPPFYATPTCLDRMYIGKWKIEGERLFLIELRAHDSEEKRITLGDLFPGRTAPIWANWYSGALRCPLGNRLKTIPIGFESIYEADLLLTIEQGWLTHVEKKINPLPSKRSREDIDLPAFLRCYPDPGPS